MFKAHYNGNKKTYLEMRKELGEEAYGQEAVEFELMRWKWMTSATTVLRLLEEKFQDLWGQLHQVDLVDLERAVSSRKKRKVVAKEGSRANLTRLGGN